MLNLPHSLDETIFKTCFPLIFSEDNSYGSKKSGENRILFAFASVYSLKGQRDFRRFKRYRMKISVGSGTITSEGMSRYVDLLKKNKILD